MFRPVHLSGKLSGPRLSERAPHAALPSGFSRTPHPHQIWPRQPTTHLAFVRRRCPSACAGRAGYINKSSPRSICPQQPSLDASLLHLSARLFLGPVAANATPTAIAAFAVGLARHLSHGRLAPKARGQRLKSSTTCPWSRVVGVADRGYLDFHRLRGWSNKAAFFVVRARRRSSFSVQRSNPVDKTLGLRCDQIIRLTNPHSHRSYPQTCAACAGGMTRTKNLWCC